LLKPSQVQVDGFPDQALIGHAAFFRGLLDGIELGLRHPHIDPRLLVEVLEKFPDRSKSRKVVLA
jgi:hypothetical protein